MTRMSRLVLAAVAALVVVGCGRAPELIDRTQPNYLKKAELLEGEWYVSDTITEVSPQAPVYPVGFGSEIDKIRFEVTESTLYAYRTYERIPGIDPQVDREKSTLGHTVTIDGKPYKGAVVAAWPISSHFDRQRQYNAATGEQNNVLEENTSDRPWYEREYMRVDWAKNMITNLEFTTDYKGPVQSYVTPIDQVTGDDAFVTEYTDKNGTRELTYFDFTVRVRLEAPTVYYEGYGQVPYCLVSGVADCSGDNVSLRWSFRKIDQEAAADYEPLTYPDTLEKKFGWYRAERVTYDKNRGVTESGRLLYARRHNIWKRAHDADGNVIPVEKREPKPIVYHLTAGFPKELLPGARMLEESWDKAFRRVVAVPRGLEITQVPQMFYVCESPVPEGAPEACGQPGTVARRGDLRFNLINFVEQNQAGFPGLLGLGPPNPDPETGEIIQGVANLYREGLDSWSSSVIETMQVLAGDISIEDLIAGADRQQYVFDHLQPTDPRRPATGPWSSQGGPLQSEPTRSLGAFANVHGELKSKIDFYRTSGLPQLKQDRRAVVDQLISSNPALESELIDNVEVRAAVLSMAPTAAFRARLEGDPDFYRTVARRTLLGTDPLVKLKEQRKQLLEKTHGCMYTMEFNDPKLYGSAKWLSQIYRDRVTALQAAGAPLADARRQAQQELYDQVRVWGFRAVGEHEVGHTLGMIHNFIGSYDAMNYLDGYWDLRKQTIGVMVGGKRVLPTTPQNLLDAAAPNQAQLDGRMREYAYSSIMDYHPDALSQIHGIGKYDEAGVLFVYGGGGEPGWVEVFNEYRRDYQSPNLSMPTDVVGKDFVVRGAQVQIPVAHADHFTPYSRFYGDIYHYTTLPFHFADAANADGSPSTFEQMLEQGISRMRNRSFRKWSEMEPLYEKLQAAGKQYRLDQGGWGSPDWLSARDVLAKVGPMPVEVPYLQCTDLEVGANLGCNRHDEGADPYELVRYYKNIFEEYYPFWNFRRDRRFFRADSGGAYASRAFFEMPNVFQQWLFDMFFYQDYYKLSAAEMEQFFGVGDPIYQNYWTMGVVDGFNMMVQPLTTPSAGYHGKLASTGAWQHLTGNDVRNSRFSPDVEAAFITKVKAGGRYNDVVYVPRGPGRSMYTLYDDQGTDFARRPVEGGHFWVQYVALMGLTTSETNFLGVDRGSDALKYAIPYYLTFYRELSGLFQNVWLDDRGSLPASLVKTGDNQATVVLPTLLRAQDYIAGFEYPVPAVSPVNGGPLPVEPIETSPTWSTRFYTELFGMAFFTDLYNSEFAQWNKVYRLGSGEQLSPAPGFEVVTFDDPFGGYTYAALKQTAGVDQRAASRMIAIAKNTKAKWDQAVGSGTVDGLTAAQWEEQTREIVRRLELMRSMANIFGTPM